MVAIIGPAEYGKETPGQAKGIDHCAGDGAEAHPFACAMACEQKARLVVEEGNLNVLNDGAYGMIKWKQTHMGFATFGLDFNNPDFVMHAESYGASGHRLESVSEFVPLVQSCFENRGVQVIDVPVDYSENDRILHHEIQELSQQI